MGQITWLHKNVSNHDIVVYNSKFQDFILKPGDSVYLDKDCYRHGLKIIEIQVQDNVPVPIEQKPGDQDKIKIKKKTKR